MHRAFIVGEDFASSCKGGRSGRVHSAFERAVNVECDPQGAVEGELLTLQSHGCDVMPASLATSAIEGELFDRCPVGARVIFTPETVHVEGRVLVHGLTSAALWRPLPQSAYEIIKLPSLRTLEERSRSILDYAAARGHPVTNFPSITLRDCAALIGWGPGLTPAGDDFIAGVLYALHFAELVCKRELAVLKEIKKSVASALDRTTRISRHFLGYACVGRWGSGTEAFLLGIVDDEQTAFQLPTARKLAHGASSGLDEIQGIIFGLSEAIAAFCHVKL